MAQLICRGKLITKVEYMLSFTRGGGSGYGFACDEAGNLLNPTPLCLKKVAELRVSPQWREKIAVYPHSYWEPGVIRCDCGQALTLYSASTNPCRCGADYNGSGQRLAPRHLWGEETGEHWSEIW